MRPSPILPLLLTVLVLSGCYAELWGGVYPVTRGERTYEGEPTAKDERRQLFGGRGRRLLVRSLPRGRTSISASPPRCFRAASRCRPDRRT